MSGIAERVAAGAAVLDRHRPGWHRQIDLARLDARTDDYLDVLSQLYGDSEQGASVLYEAEVGSAAAGVWGLTSPTNCWARDHGFDIDTPVWDVLGAYAELADQWRAEIARHQPADQTPAAATETEAEPLRRLAEAINTAHRRSQSTISAAPVDVAGVAGVNLYNHASPRGPQPLDTVWHVGAGEPLPGGGHATAACFVWGPAYNWSAPTADLQAAAAHVAQTAGRWPDRDADSPVPPADAPTDQRDQPDPEDAYLRPSGPLGALTSASLAGVFLGEFDTTQQAEQAIRAEMDRSRFWPNVWWVDDHGGLTAWPLDPVDQPPEDAP